jgi:hypothetical protein
MRLICACCMIGLLVMAAACTGQKPEGPAPTATPAQAIPGGTEPTPMTLPSATVAVDEPPLPVPTV